MKTKTLLSIAIIAALPFMANAENISGNMYTAPTSATQQNPAPTTSAEAPYGRVNIDTADQNHIATTAYVKGAYNSAIAAVNKSVDYLTEISLEKQDILLSSLGEDVASGLTDYSNVRDLVGYLMSGDDEVLTDNELLRLIPSVPAVAGMVKEGIDTQRVTIYTTWDDDSANATTQVALSTAQ